MKSSSKQYRSLAFKWMKRCALPLLATLFVTPKSLAGVDLVGLNLSGAGFASHVLPGVNGTNYIFPSESHFKYWSSQGVTLIRFPVIWERLQPTLGGALEPKYAALIDRTFAYAQKYNVKIILDLHNYARYRGRIIGTSSVPYTRYQEIMTKIAQRWSSQSSLYAYDIMNEPNGALAYWPTAAQYGINGVRAVDTTRPIIVEGNGWASATRWAEWNDSLLKLKDPSNNIIFSAHSYFDENAGGSYDSVDVNKLDVMYGVNRVKPFVEWLKKHGKRGYIGEFGVPDNNPRWNILMDNMLAYLKQNCIPASYWAAGPGWGNYFMSVEPVSGKDRPQWATLKKYINNTSCTAIGPISSTSSSTSSSSSSSSSSTTPSTSTGSSTSSTPTTSTGTSGSSSSSSPGTSTSNSTTTTGSSSSSSTSGSSTSANSATSGTSSSGSSSSTGSSSGSTTTSGSSSASGTSGSSTTTTTTVSNSTSPSTSKLDLVGLNLSGASFAPQVLPGVNGTNYLFPSESYFKAWSEKGVRLIRFPILWERIQPKLNNMLDPAHVQLVQQTMNLAQKYNIKVILVLQNSARYKGEIIGAGKVTLANYHDVMYRLAYRWASHPALYGYDIMAKPYGTEKYWAQAAQYGINGVRTVDRTHPVIIESDAWSNASLWPYYSDGLLNLKDSANNILFSANVYFDKDGSGTYNAEDMSEFNTMIGVNRVKPFVEWLQKNKRKGLIGEFGVPDNDSRWLTAMDNLLAYLKQNCMPATYWAAGPGWGSNKLAVEPVNGQARPQWATLKKYVDSSNSCTAVGPN